MEHNIRASVAMAAYNGLPYISQQIESILQAMGPDDELIISDDGSTDGTRQKLTEYEKRDSRITVLDNISHGVAKNFNHAVMACQGRYIFLSDQDDVWDKEKIRKIVELFEKTGADVIIHNAEITNADLTVSSNTLFDLYGTSNSPFRNFIKNSFMGCCMAFQESFRSFICPFPEDTQDFIFGHDQWIGVMAGIYGKIIRCPDCLIKHRLHGNNETPSAHRKVHILVKHRLYFLCALMDRNKRIHKKRC